MNTVYCGLLLLSTMIVLGSSDSSAQVNRTEYPANPVFTGGAYSSPHQQGTAPTVNVKTPQQESRLSDTAVLVKRIDHIVCQYNTIEEVDSMMRVFNGLLELPQWFKPGVRWFDPAQSPFYNTGVYAGNVFLEFMTYNVQYPSAQTKTYRPYKHAFAFANDITTTGGELDQRGVQRSQPYHFSVRKADQTLDTVFTNITLPELQNSLLMVFFCQYHIGLFDCDVFDFGDLPPLVDPDDQHPYYRNLLEQINGGPLRLECVQNICISTTDQSFPFCRSTFGKIILPATEYEIGKWALPSGPELICQIGPQKYHLASITFVVESLKVAKAFLASQNLAYEETDGYIKLGLGINIGVDLLLRDPTTSVEYDVESLPGVCLLDQNYPNPFNPQTVISFQLPVATKADLRVYDLLGREVAVLVNEEMMPGTYTVPWNATGMASGIYFYSLRAGAFHETRHMVLLR